MNSVSEKFVRHSVAYLSVEKWLVGDVPLKVNFLVKVNHSLARERLPAMRISNKILCISYVHRKYNRGGVNTFVSQPT